jgi:hypothetical protein
MRVSGMIYLDKDGKRIKHGRKYIYTGVAPVIPEITGTVRWSRHFLMYLFHPDEKYPIFSIPFQWEGFGTCRANHISLEPKEE